MKYTNYWFKNVNALIKSLKLKHMTACHNIIALVQSQKKKVTSHEERV